MQVFAPPKPPKLAPPICLDSRAVGATASGEEILEGAVCLRARKLHEMIESCGFHGIAGDATSVRYKRTHSTQYACTVDLLTLEYRKHNGKTQLHVVLRSDHSVVREHGNVYAWKAENHIDLDGVREMMQLVDLLIETSDRPGRRI